MNNQALTTEYNGVVITYDESTSKFMFILRGRERSADSLRAAKETIDKPAPKDQSDFKPIEAWYIRYSGDPEPCVITNTAIAASFETSKQFWVKIGKQRSKQGAMNLFPKTPENDSAVAQIVAARKEADALEERIRKLKDGLTPLPKDVA